MVSRYIDLKAFLFVPLGVSSHGAIVILACTMHRVGVTFAS